MGNGTIKVLAILCLLQLCGALRNWTDLRVRYSLLKSRGFYQIPLSTNYSFMKGFVRTQPEASFKLPIDFYCYPEDPRSCFMFDKNGNVAGVQISILKSDVANVDPKFYDYSAVTSLKETNFFNIPAFSFRTYFTNPEKLTKAGRKDTEETAEGIWVYLEGKLYEIPRQKPPGSRFDDFYKQGCLRSMGLHYFYKINGSLPECRTVFPFFVLYEGTSMVAYGLALPGQGSKGPNMDWYEHPPLLALSLITPNRPPCMMDLAKKYGLTSMHVYLVDRPWDITCTVFDKVINAVTYWTPIA